MEETLRGWKPRPPSPRLHQRLFAKTAAGKSGDEGMRLGDFCRWLVPAVGCFILVVSSLSARFPQADYHAFASTNFLLPVSVQESPVEVSLLPQARARYEQNSVPVTTVELRFAPTSRVAQPGGFPKTNALIQ